MLLPACINYSRRFTSVRRTTIRGQGMKLGSGSKIVRREARSRPARCGLRMMATLSINGHTTICSRKISSRSMPMTSVGEATGCVCTLGEGGSLKSTRAEPSMPPRECRNDGLPHLGVGGRALTRFARSQIPPSDRVTGPLGAVIIRAFLDGRSRLDQPLFGRRSESRSFVLEKAHRKM